MALISQTLVDTPSSNSVKKACMRKPCRICNTLDISDLWEDLASMDSASKEVLAKLKKLHTGCRIVTAAPHAWTCTECKYRARSRARDKDGNPLHKMNPNYGHISSEHVIAGSRGRKVNVAYYNKVVDVYHACGRNYAKAAAKIGVTRQAVEALLKNRPRGRNIQGGPRNLIPETGSANAAQG